MVWESNKKSRRSEILRAALRCFDEQGYDGTGLTDIRDRAGASIGSIYHHFGSKAAIASALYQDGLENHHNGFIARLRRVTTAEQLIKESVRYHIDWALEHPTWARFLMLTRRIDAVASIEPELRSGTRAFVGEALAITKPFLERGEIRRMPINVFIAQLVGPAQELIRVSLSGKAEIDFAEAREQLAAAAWRALGVPT